MIIAKIISGGQAGVDRGALDAAIALGIPHGGWCPRGRRAEDGRIPDRYALNETPSGDFPQRTEWNVIEATATLVLYDGRVPMSPGTRKTIALAAAVAEARSPQERSHRHHLINLHPHAYPVTALGYWLKCIRPDARVVNIAGPRESKCPGIQAAVTALLLEVLR